MNGIELALRFSFITNKLRYCGPEHGSDIFLDYLKTKKDESKVREALEKFEGLYPYLSAIAEKHGKDFLDYDVVEAYWIGNALLDDFTDKDMQSIIAKLMKRGLPKSMGERLIKKMPSGFFPHHNFNVFYVGVGNTTGSVPTTLQNMDNCRISSGKVAEVIGDHLVVVTDAAAYDKKTKRYSLKQDETKTAIFLPEMLGDVKKGDVVALHWGFACTKLTEGQAMNLKKYEMRILNVVNKC